MAYGTKRLDKKKNKGKNRIGGRHDHLRLDWYWDLQHEEQTGKKFIRSRAVLGNYHLLVDRIRYGFIYRITLANRKDRMTRTPTPKEEKEDWTFNPVKEYFETELPGAVYPLYNRVSTRIDAQLQAEQVLYKHLKKLVREMEKYK